MNKIFKISESSQDLQLNCDCSEIEQDHIVTTIVIDDDNKSEIALCCNCAASRYSDTEQNTWLDEDEDTFKYAPKSVTEHHKAEKNKVLSDYY